MKIPQEKREEIIARMEATELRPEAKETARALLAKEELTDEEMGKLLRVIQEDIDKDFDEIPGVTEAVENDAEYQALVAKQEAELAEIEADAKQSADFIEEQATELDAIEADLTKAEDEMRLEEVKGNLGV